MQLSKIFFRAASGIDYELTVEYDEWQSIPKFLTEDDKGWIQDLVSNDGWKSLLHMSHDLKCTVISWGSEIGD